MLSSFPILSFGFLSMLEMVRMGLWATLMLKLRRTFATFSEKPAVSFTENALG